MRLLLFWVCVALCTSVTYAQENFLVTNNQADSVIKGLYNTTDFPAGAVINPAEFASVVNQAVNPDTLKSYILKLATFGNRNTGSDTTSTTTGIGAARRWVYSKFQEYQQTNPRVIPSYFQFDEDICEANQHRNILAVLPGNDIADPSVVVVEGHIDSRCAGVCDIECDAQGIEDNATGTALVMELARVMSAYQLKRTIVFMVTIGEEQGLHGANAFSQYCVDEGINVRAVFNNDVIGGILCGKTASPPGCTTEDAVDSTSVRIFSFAGANSAAKNLARFAKIEYQEDLKPMVGVPMELRIMSPEDRGGRGGDHIPFRVDGFPAIRYCAANEHGDASNGPDYEDRQHTEEDILGLDTDGDMVIDSFFVDFNYLARNTVINGVSASAAANGPLSPEISVVVLDDGRMEVTIDPTEPGVAYKIGIRTLANDFDSLYTTTELVDTLERVGSNVRYFITACTVDENGIESLFGNEVRVFSRVGIAEENDFEDTGIFLQANRPNPFDEATYIMFEADQRWQGKQGLIEIMDNTGRVIHKMQTTVENGHNEVLYRHGEGTTGILHYRLSIEGQALGTKSMIFAN